MFPSLIIGRAMLSVAVLMHSVSQCYQFVRMQFAHPLQAGLGIFLLDFVDRVQLLVGTAVQVVEQENVLNGAM